MDYRAALSRLFDLKRYVFEPGVERTERLLATLDHPERAFEAIQIAGTNGKGSTAAMAANILREAGYTVGMYTSPHLEEFSERITVDGRPITDTAITRFVETVEVHLDEAAAADQGPTFFETVTAMAFWYFAERSVDIAVIEAGIGGANDATSVISPDAAVVTTVDLEHTDVLGETIEEIAADKAGIAPDDGPFVTGARGRAREVVLSKHPDGIVVDATPEADVAAAYEGLTDTYEGAIHLDGAGWSVRTTTPILGPGQALNAGIAAAVTRSRWSVDEGAIARGIRGVEWPGRGELVGRRPLVLLDGAHNPAAIGQLADLLGDLTHERLHLVFGALEDKDIRGMVAALPDPDTVVTCRPVTTRAVSPTVIASIFENRDVGRIERHRSVESALETALEIADPDDLVVVTGSLYTVGEARRRWTRQLSPRRLTSIPEARDALKGCYVSDAGVVRMRGKGVHRAVHLRVVRRQAQYLKEELLSLGGECGVSNVDVDTEPVDVMLMATLAQYRRLIQHLERQSGGPAHIGEQLRRVLGIEHHPDFGDWPWAEEQVLMGIVNVTPDSFHDGGEHFATEAAIDHARTLADEGARIVDIGGESTRPGGDAVGIDRELERVIPVIEGIADVDALVSIDTRKAQVAREALDAGADIVNDVSGLSDPEMAPLVGEYDAPIVVAHSQSTPVDPSVHYTYDDVVREVVTELGRLVRRCERYGIDRSQVIVDPGVGFGKSPEENFALVDRLEELRALGCPIMIGHSNKSMFSHLGYDTGDRLDATVAVTAMAFERGADIVRVHDVAENEAARRAAALFRNSR